jgi:hypothetical protein
MPEDCQCDRVHSRFAGLPSFLTPLLPKWKKKWKKRSEFKDLFSIEKSEGEGCKCEMFVEY